LFQEIEQVQEALHLFKNHHLSLTDVETNQEIELACEVFMPLSVFQVPCKGVMAQMSQSE